MSHIKLTRMSRDVWKIKFTINASKSKGLDYENHMVRVYCNQEQIRQDKTGKTCGVMFSLTNII